MPFLPMRLPASIVDAPSKKWAVLNAQTLTTQAVAEFLSLCTVAIDDQQLWSDEEIASARVRMTREYPGLSARAVAARYGEDETRVAIETIRATRADSVCVSRRLICSKATAAGGRSLSSLWECRGQGSL